MKSMQCILAAAVLCVGAAGALARSIEERRPLAADGLVTIKLISGSVTVEGWDRKEVEVTGTITGDLEDVTLTGTENRLKIEAEYPRDSHNVRGDADLDIKVPVGAGVRVSAVNAPLTAAKIDGELELETVNGRITASGKPASVEAKTVNGAIEITATSDRIQAETVGGRIQLDGVEGDVSASTVGGSIHVSGGDFTRVKFSSVSGTIEFAGNLDRKGTFEFNSHSGDIWARPSVPQRANWKRPRSSASSAEPSPTPATLSHQKTRPSKPCRRGRSR